MTQNRVASVVRPKASGVVNLLRLAERAGWDLEFVLCSSSTSSLAGYAGQVGLSPLPSPSLSVSLSL